MSTSKGHLNLQNLTTGIAIIAIFIITILYIDFDNRQRYEQKYEAKSEQSLTSPTHKTVDEEAISAARIYEHENISEKERLASHILNKAKMIEQERARFEFEMALKDANANAPVPVPNTDMEPIKISLVNNLTSKTVASANVIYHTNGDKTDSKKMASAVHDIETLVQTSKAEYAIDIIDFQDSKNDSKRQTAVSVNIAIKEYMTGSNSAHHEQYRTSVLIPVSPDDGEKTMVTHDLSKMYKLILTRG